MNMTIKLRLFGLGVLSILLLSIAGGVGYWSMTQLNNSMNMIVVNSTILKNHLTADMMHDALSSDAMSAIVAAKTGNSKEIQVINENFKEHSSTFIEMLTENQKLLTDAEVRAALNNVMPALKDYIATAGSIIDMAANDQESAIKHIGKFNSAYDSLAKEMEVLTELIESDTTKVQQAGSDTAAASENTVLIIILAGILLMTSISGMVSVKITRSLSKLVEASKTIASGDLTVRLAVENNDEIGALTAAMEAMRSHLLEMISHITSTTTQLSTAAEEMSAITMETNRNVQRQQAETDQVAAAMTEMTATVQEVANNIAYTANSASEAKDETLSGNQVVNKSIDQIQVLERQVEGAAISIKELAQNSSEISEVLDVIKSIAEQTNLLALNAAIEAARAGEQGRGFAVVADEVRTLASRTQLATQEINQMIEKIQSGSQTAVDAIEKSYEQTNIAVKQVTKAGESLIAISASVSRINDMSTQIASSAEEQSAVSEEINRNIVAIRDMSVHTAKGAEQTSIASNELSRMAIDLQSTLGQFKS
ncbi:methyl-accepting chemotaxis protein [Amphritea pacifica]|uniref:methyl-accepting chemotaxis protein n=1 Tax=Amphritea pacifica TaxID=2811233 RepID=UPI001964920D|nr:methyl-accepting chemotaxis protein [Amphritea pacifica]MBN1006099.1 methyl-accepting chemotaxis protein [Amphritea pacifica]